VLRLARFIRLARFVVIVARALQAERRLTSGDSLRVAALLTVTGIIVGGAAQHEFSTGEFGSLWDGDWRPQINRVCAAARRGDPPALANLIRSKTSEAVGREVTRREPDVRSGRNPGLDIQPSGPYLSN
jgi:hypothetical protein